MKFNYFIFGGILTLMTIALIIAYGNKKESRLIISNDYDATINQGLQYEGIDKNQVLSIEQLKDDEELVFFTLIMLWVLLICLKVKVSGHGQELNLCMVFNLQRHPVI